MRSIFNGSVGTIMGETSPFQFKFMIGRRIGSGTYVKVRAEGKDWILARVEDIKRSNSAFSINQFHGSVPNGNGREMVMAEARVIGVGGNGRLRLPTTPVRPGDPVFLADDKLIKAALGLTKGDLYIGHLRGYDICVQLDANSLVQKHCSVLAKTGSGKSYSAAVILEELLEKNVALLIIDPHGEYISMKEPNQEGDFSKFGIEPRGYDVVVYTPTDMALNPRADKAFRFNDLNLSARELARMIPHDNGNGQMGLLYEVISTLNAEMDTFSLDDVVDQVIKSNSKIKWNLAGQLETLLDLGLYSSPETPLEELLMPGTASVLDMTGIAPETQAMIVAKLLTEIFEARKRGLISPGMVVIEEAHNYIPERGTGNAASTNIIRTIAAEGRKFGLGLMVISQRPARVDKNVLSQCNTQIIMRVTNPNDLKALSKGLEGMTAELEDEIKRLPAGVAMLVNNEIERPITVNIRSRKSKHGGVSTPIILKEKDSAWDNSKLIGIGSGLLKPPKIEDNPGRSLLRKVFGVGKI